MALPVTIPNTFANATSSIPLSQLDTNFSTLANAVNGLNSGSETLANLKATTANVGVLTVTGNATIGDASTDTVTLNSTLTANTAVIFAAGTSAAPSITTTGDLNTGIFFPAADTIAFAEGGAEAMRIDSSGNVGIGTTSPIRRLVVSNSGAEGLEIGPGSVNGDTAGAVTSIYYNRSGSAYVNAIQSANSFIYQLSGVEGMRIDSSGNVLVGTTGVTGGLSGKVFNIFDTGTVRSIVQTTGQFAVYNIGSGGTSTTPTVAGFMLTDSTAGTLNIYASTNHPMLFGTNNTERARITSGGDFLVGLTASSITAVGTTIYSNGEFNACTSGIAPISVNRKASDGNLVRFFQDDVEEGNISVSGNTVSYNGFSGGHWTQLQQGRGYNPEILRGTVMSSIGEMCEWKSVTWTETIEHSAVPAVEAKEAVLDEEGNVIEPAIEAVEGKDAWTETIPHREAYFGQLPVGATFEEDGVTKTVVDDGNERLPKVKISDVVGDKAVYGVFQTYDEFQDMLVTSLGAFVVRIAAGVTVQIGDLLESNGDGCAKVQDDDVIRSKTIGKVTSTTPSATYADGSYTVPAVLYCG